ncbi:MAG: sugar ABC transporter substrate-binding protein [Lachnospiraceae bacterium]|nr:sugar ABC transporter substrate-binding protein [Lachnospiraceae bacterium]
MEAKKEMKKMKKLFALLLVVTVMGLALVGCDKGGNNGGQAAESGKTAGFVTFGLGGDFFQALADEFVTVFEGAGWTASYADGSFDPTKQIEAAENFIAQGVDVLFIWSVAPEAMDSTIQKAMDAGIKVIAFVAPTAQYDALMVSDDAELADSMAKMAAAWIDEAYADAADGSVPVAVFSERDAETGVIQADELLKIAEFSKKVDPNAVKEVACTAEDISTGQAAMENLNTTNPEIKVYLTAHNAIAQGINSFFTGVSSPVSDFTGYGIFAINGDDASANLIKESIDGKNPFRGMVLTGSVNDTANEMLEVATGIMDGTLESGHVQKAGTIFVNAQTVDEYLSTGHVDPSNLDFLK